MFRDLLNEVVGKHVAILSHCSSCSGLDTIFQCISAGNELAECIDVPYIDDAEFTTGRYFTDQVHMRHAAAVWIASEFVEEAVINFAAYKQHFGIFRSFMVSVQRELYNYNYAIIKIIFSANY